MRRQEHEGRVAAREEDVVARACDQMLDPRDEARAVLLRPGGEEGLVAGARPQRGRGPGAGDGRDPIAGQVETPAGRDDRALGALGHEDRRRFARHQDAARLG